MKKVPLDIMLGRRTKNRYKRRSPKTITFRANFPVGSAAKTPLLTASMGLYGVKIDDVCNQFNQESELMWKKSTLIPIVLVLSQRKTHSIEYKAPSVYTLYRLLFRRRRRKEYRKARLKYKVLVALYQIALLKTDTTNDDVMKGWISQILGTIFSCHFTDPRRRRKVQSKWILKRIAKARSRKMLV